MSDQKRHREQMQSPLSAPSPPRDRQGALPALDDVALSDLSWLRTKAALALRGSFSSRVRGKALDLLNERGAVRRDKTDDLVFWVRPRPGVRYRVQVILPREKDEDLYLSCSCPNGQCAGGTLTSSRQRADGPPRCYHGAACLQLVLEGLYLLRFRRSGRSVL